jgi:hypothetical protein
MPRTLGCLLTCLALLASAVPAARAQSVGSAFTYQGELRAAGAPANAAYDFQFRLYNSPGGTTQLGPQLTANAVTVANGLFSLPLDFGPAQFAGDAQWLEISVRPAGSGAFETLVPRTAVTATPYALGAVAALANSVTTTSVVDGSLQFADANAAQFQARVTGACSGSQGIQSIAANGTVVCGTFGGGGGTITGVTAGTGLAGGGSSGVVSLGIAAGGVGSAQVNPAQVQLRVSGTCPPGQFLRQVGQAGNVDCSPDGTGSDWSLGGNAGTNPATQFIGTTDNTPLELRAANQRIARYEAVELPGPAGGATANVVHGSPDNSVGVGMRGATIGGGGARSAGSDPDLPLAAPNRVVGRYGTIGGGAANLVGGAIAQAGTIAGGLSNRATGNYASIGGGFGNRSLGAGTVVAGGANNVAQAEAAGVLAGIENAASGVGAVVTGGAASCAGGDYSWAAGRFAKVRVSTARVVPPDDTQHGCFGVASSPDFDGDEGTFAWADSQASSFTSTGPDQFLVRARGGLALNGTPPLPSIEVAVFGNDAAAVGGFANLFLREAGATVSNAGVLVSAGGASNSAGANNAGLYFDQYVPDGAQQRRLSIEPGGAVRVDPSTRLEFGSTTRQMIDLWGAAGDYGIGVQAGTQYFRSNTNFGWYAGGSHDNAALSPGAGGARLLVLEPGALTLRSPNAGGDARISVGTTVGAPASNRWDLRVLGAPLVAGSATLPAGTLVLQDDAAVRAAFEPTGLTRNASGAWTTFSDRRLKKNIGPIASALDTLLRLRGHWFEYLDPAQAPGAGGPRMGFVAQEVRDTLPSWVSADPSGVLSVTPTGFEALAVEALRQLHEENAVVDDAHAARLAALEAENAALRARLDALEAALRDAPRRP